MTNRQSRIFAVAATAISALLFLVLTVDSHRQFPGLTHSQNITPEVSHGNDVWHKYNCINCHTLFGEGAYYAPDLTKITQHRGEAYLTAYMKDPSNFYDEQQHRRLMPTQDLSDEEIHDLIRFLDWVANVDNQGWPPRPILVTGGMVADNVTDDAVPPGTRPVDEGDDPVAKGERLFRTVSPGCNPCHSTSPGADMAGPTLAGLVSRAEEIVASDTYQGEAETVEGYIRESIIAPSNHLVPGDMYSANGTSFMPTGYGDNLSDEEVDQLVAYIMSIR